MDQSLEDEFLRVISPLGMRASLHALEMQASVDSDRTRALARQLQEAQYKQRRAFEQYDESDPRNRLVAAELERRWNEALQNVKLLQAEIEAAKREHASPSKTEEQEILALGEEFSSVWKSEDCPMTLKKKIVGTVVKEMIVSENESGAELRFIIHWKGGVHTEFRIPKPRSGKGRKTSLDDLDVIRRMAVRYGDDAIARVLSKLKRRTGTGKRWNALRVKSVRDQYKISGQACTRADPECLTRAQAAKHCQVSNTTIHRLVEEGVLANHQIVPWAPWEIRRTDLDNEPVRGILQYLHETGRLRLGGNDLTIEPTLFP